MSNRESGGGGAFFASTFQCGHASNKSDAAGVIAGRCGGSCVAGLVSGAVKGAGAVKGDGAGSVGVVTPTDGTRAGGKAGVLSSDGVIGDKLALATAGGTGSVRSSKDTMSTFTPLAAAGLTMGALTGAGGVTVSGAAVAVAGGGFLVCAATGRLDIRVGRHSAPIVVRATPRRAVVGDASAASATGDKSAGDKVIQRSGRREREEIKELEGSFAMCFIFLHRRRKADWVGQSFCKFQ